MPERSDVFYFGAGPAPLPTPVIEASAAAFVNYEKTGLGLAEISHRSPTANKIIADAKAALTTLYDVPGDYEICFMQAGGTGEFSATLQNLVGVWVERRRRQIVAELGASEDTDEVVSKLKEAIVNELKVDYLVTGSWSNKASQEASRLIGSRYVNVAVNAKKANGGKFGIIPDEKDWKLTPTKKEGGTGSAMVYLCDNETVDGVEFPSFPQCLESQGGDEADERIVVADLSSNFISRKVDVKKYGIIFAGAQKNLGIAGITVLIIRKSLLALRPDPILLQKVSDVLPSAIPPIMFDFPTLVSNNSLYNTLPVFNLYVATLVLQNLVSTYGEHKVTGQQMISEKKAQLLYDTLDAHPDTYKVVPAKAIRSRMNICFRIVSGAATDGEAAVPDDAKEKKFIAGAEERGLLGLKGHRSVGGMRASNYNAVPLEAVEKLSKYLQEFAAQK